MVQKKRRPRRALGKIAQKGKRFYAEYHHDGKVHTPGKSYGQRLLDPVKFRFRGGCPVCGAVWHGADMLDLATAFA